MKRPLAVALLFSVLVGVTARPASAGETRICWYGSTSGYGSTASWGLICRINGTVVKSGSPGWVEPTTVLVYDVGYDRAGECYYRRTGKWSGWVQTGRDGRWALFAWDPDGIRGGHLIADARLRQCVSQPRAAKPEQLDPYDIIRAFKFEKPDPVLVPAIGLTGVATQVDVDPPDAVSKFVKAPTGSVIEAKFRVVSVDITWGDGTKFSIPESRYDLFAPHPGGRVRHLWETKDYYTMRVEYKWRVEWRANNGPWKSITVPATDWTTSYRVDEVVGRRSG